jgi:hypothetical protein
MTTGSASAFGEEVELTAQVVFLRRKSARLVFADTITSCGLRTEVVFKAWTDRCVVGARWDMVVGARVM